jgi:hypothetical protein
MIDKAVENFRFLKQMGQAKEAAEIKSKILDIKFAKSHLVMVLSMDFAKPTAAMKKTARESSIDLKDERVIDEFKAIQQSNLEDIRRMKAGEQPLNQTEIKERRDKFMQEKYP